MALRPWFPLLVANAGSDAGGDDDNDGGVVIFAAALNVAVLVLLLLISFLLFLLLIFELLFVSFESPGPFVAKYSFFLPAFGDGVPPPSEK